MRRDGAPIKRYARHQRLLIRGIGGLGVSFTNLALPAQAAESGGRSLLSTQNVRCRARICDIPACGGQSAKEIATTAFQGVAPIIFLTPLKFRPPGKIVFFTPLKSGNSEIGVDLGHLAIFQVDTIRFIKAANSGLLSDRPNPDAIIPPLAAPPSSRATAPQKQRQC